jgi:DNA-binding protein HU-beta
VKAAGSSGNLSQTPEKVGKKATFRAPPEKRSVKVAGVSNHISKGATMPKGPLSKSALVQTLADRYSDKLSRKDVKTLLESIVQLGHAELKKNGIFVLPGLVRMVVVKKPATKERKGINPFTGEPTVFKAKPARKVIKARPVKAAKDAIG